MKKLLIVMVCLVLVCSGCGQEEEGEPVLTLAVCQGMGRLHEELIWEINEGDYPFSVDVVDYLEAAQGDISLAIQNLNKDIAAGEGPDIIDLSSFSIDIDQYAANGVLEDLYPYLDADQELGREDLVESVLPCCEYNGQLTAILSGFTVKTLYASSGVCEGQTSWTVSDFIPYAGNIGVASLDYRDTLDAETLLMQLSTTTFASFVDYEAKTVMFDAPEFAAVLEACRSACGGDAGDILLRMDSLGSFMETQMCESAMGGEIKYLGFPTLDGQSAGHFISNQNDYLAICASSKHKDAAWELLRMFLTEDFQRECYITPISHAFPTNQNVLNELAEYSQSVVYDEDGSEITQRGSYSAPYRPATQEEIAKVLAAINSLTRCQRSDAVLYDIISEEITSFLNGAHSAEETAGLIQSRVGIYVAE